MLGSIAAVVGIASGVNSLMGGGGGSGSSGGAATTAAADPFSPYRANLASMYSGALQPGAKTDLTQLPGYSQYQSGVVDPALEASKRSAAASGMMRSGNEQIALQDTAQKGYYGFMTDYLNRLAQGSGAANNPATAVGMGLNATQSGYQALGQGIGGLTTLSNQFSGTNSGWNPAWGSSSNPVYQSGSDSFVGPVMP
jgi:hypothetical protein